MLMGAPQNGQFPIQFLVSTPGALHTCRRFTVRVKDECSIASAVSWHILENASDAFGVC